MRSTEGGRRDGGRKEGWREEEGMEEGKEEQLVIGSWDRGTD